MTDNSMFSLTAPFSYVFAKGGVEPVQDSFTLMKALRQKPQPLSLDIGSVLNKISLPFMVANDTLLAEVKVRHESNKDFFWESFPQHGSLRPDDEKDYAKTIYEAMEQELYEQVSECSRVLLLLSGGMDSRIVAGILRNIQLTKNGNLCVVAATWGDENSRDVVYAKEIAGLFDWEILHFKLDAALLKRNIEFIGQGIPEYSALHLHAMLCIRDIAMDFDLILAGSYGDSVCRGEYSGIHASRLQDITDINIDPFRVLDKKLRDKYKDFLKQRNKQFFKQDKSASLVRNRELQQEFFYMRRMLNSAMAVMEDGSRLYQAFTNPIVYGLFWSLDVSIRDDRWYYLILNHLPQELNEIPWARTNKIFYTNRISRFSNDRLKSSYHNYSDLLRGELRNFIKDKVFGSEISNLGLFDMRSLKRLHCAWLRQSSSSNSRLDELFCWLASLAIFLEKNEIYNEYNGVDVSNSFVDRLVCVVKSNVYIKARNTFRS